MEVLAKSAPDRKAEIERKLATGSLSTRERAWLCELIGAEFSDTGLGDDFEPNARGKRLEFLLDEINRPNLHPT
jgi:hypothetical protein